MAKPTKTNATKFQYETASASDPIDMALAVDFCLWLGLEPTVENLDAAKRALQRSRD